MQNNNKFFTIRPKYNKTRRLATGINIHNTGLFDHILQCLIINLKLNIRTDIIIWLLSRWKMNKHCSVGKHGVSISSDTYYWAKHFNWVMNGQENDYEYILDESSAVCSSGANNWRIHVRFRHQSVLPGPEYQYFD